MYKYPHFHQMRAIGKRAAECLSLIGNLMKPGMTAYDIDLFVKKYADVYSLGCPQFGYENSHLSSKAFPGHCCVSINDEVAHGIPTEDKVFHMDDLVKVDVTFTDQDGWHGDSCQTFMVGGRNPPLLMSVGYLAMSEGINAVEVGKPISDIGKAIEIFVEKNGFFVNKDYCGHSIGKEFHMEPKIPNFYDPDYDKIIIKPGMMFTIEPMVMESSQYYYINEDNMWTIETADGGKSIQYEHTVGIDEDGKVCIFTLT